MKIRLCLLVLGVMAAAGVARAQDGCIDSPECPTAVLAVAGAAGILAVRKMRH